MTDFYIADSFIVDVHIIWLKTKDGDTSYSLIIYSYSIRQEILNLYISYSFIVDVKYIWIDGVWMEGSDSF